MKVARESEKCPRAGLSGQDFKVSPAMGGIAAGVALQGGRWWRPCS